MIKPKTETMSSTVFTHHASSTASQTVVLPTPTGAVTGLRTKNDFKGSSESEDTVLTIPTARRNAVLGRQVMVTAAGV
jgi:hypothetical protein